MWLYAVISDRSPTFPQLKIDLTTNSAAAAESKQHFLSNGIKTTRAIRSGFRWWLCSAPITRVESSAVSTVVERLQWQHLFSELNMAGISLSLQNV